MGPNKEFVVDGPWILLLLRHPGLPGFGGAASASPLTALLPGHVLELEFQIYPQQ